MSEEEKLNALIGLIVELGIECKLIAEQIDCTAEAREIEKIISRMEELTKK